MEDTLIIGAGNLLFTDDGVGIHAIQRLQAPGKLPEGVDVLDGGTLGLNLLAYLEGVRSLLIIDAMDTGRSPGTLVRLAGDQVPAYFSLKISPHQVSIPDLLLAAKLVGLYPQELVILGVQPESTDTGLELSPSVAAQLDRLVALAVDEVKRMKLN
jgi:hydrogenase maturation protease